MKIKLKHGITLIKGTVLSEKGYFILDTGAPGVILNNRYFKGGEPSDLEISTIFTEISDIKNLGTIAVTLNEETQQACECITTDLRDPERALKVKLLGIIGYTFLKNFVVSCDYKRKEIVFSRVPLETKLKPNPLTIDDHFLIVEGTLNGTKVSACFDTGANICLFSEKLNKSDNIIVTVHKKVRALSTSETKEKMGISIVKDLNFFGVNEKKTIGVFSDFFLDNEAIKFDCIIGYSYFKRKRFIIDYLNKTIYM